MIVGDHHNGLAELSVEALEQHKHFFRRLSIKVAGQLVVDQQSRIGHDCTGDFDTLLLAAKLALSRFKWKMPVPGGVRV